MDSYNSFDFGGGLFLSNHHSSTLGLGNLDRLTSTNGSNPTRHYDIFSSFRRPQLPFSNEDLLSNSDEDDENVTPSAAGLAPRLPLFSRCPLTNQVRMEKPASPNRSVASVGVSPNTAGGKMRSSMSLSPLKNLSLNSPFKSRPLTNSSAVNSSRYGDYDPLLGGAPRIPLLNLNNLATFNSSYNVSPNNSFSSTSSNGQNSYLDSISNNNNNNNTSFKSTYSQMARKEPSPPLIEPPRTTSSPTRSAGEVNCVQTCYVPPANPKPSKNVVAKLSLDDVKDDSAVAMNNKHGKGKYWFKSGSPTPDPRWQSCQQLMIGPIPGDVEYSTLRSAFLSKGHTIHLFIQNNQAWLEKNQEKFGKKQVKFGYVVYTDSSVASRLLAQGYVVVGYAKVAVKEMDGQPAQFVN